MIPYTMTPRGITFFHDGKQRTVSAEHVNYKDIINSILENDTTMLDNYINIPKFVAAVTQGKVVITTDDEVYYDNKPVHEYLASRIIEHYKINVDLVKPLLKFTERLMKNPNTDVRDDLFKWLEKGNMPICEDGSFLAYKLVRGDFSPIHQGPYGQDQSPGTLVEMPREACDHDRDQTCSRGLHFCSYEYLPLFQSWNGHMGEKVILLKICPSDVVAIPTDYNLTKGRTCRFFVLQEIDPSKIKEDFGNLLVYKEGGREYFDDEYSYDDEEEFYYDEESSGSNTPQLYSKENVEQAIIDCGGNKTKAAARLGISRSTLYRILNKN